MSVDYIKLSMEIIGIVSISILGYYGIKLVGAFKRGMLERGWRLVTEGAIILVTAQIPFLVAGIFPSAYDTLLGYAGNLVRFIGLVFLILGFRAQYQVWRVDNKKIIESAPKQKTRKY